VGAPFPPPPPAVVLLGIADVGVLVVGCLPVGFLNMWFHVVAEAVGGFHGLVVGGAEDVGFAFAVEVVMAVGGGWVGGIVAQTEALSFVPVG
jgi:hypothetical protein